MPAKKQFNTPWMKSDTILELLDVILFSISMIENVDYSLQINMDIGWAQAIYTDEMSVKLYMERSSKDYVWRKAKEEFYPDCISYHKHSTGMGMMFWGAFRKGRMGPGVFNAL